jgi:CheY-like chemotaxis protein
MVAAEKRILVVDDEEIVRESCQRALSEAGYSVRTVARGRDALAACRDERFDVMFTDLRMPDMDGIDVIREVTREYPDIRVVVITGYPSRETAKDADDLGTFDYLVKPVSANRLSDAVASVLARASRPAPTIAPVPTAAPALPAAEPTPAPEKTVLAHQSTAQKRPSVMTRATVLTAIGFLIGVSVAYFLAPSQALAYLAVGTAIGSGTLLGLFSDGVFARNVAEQKSE